MKLLHTSATRRRMAFVLRLTRRSLALTTLHSPQLPLPAYRLLVQVNLFSTRFTTAIFYVHIYTHTHPQDNGPELSDIGPEHTPTYTRLLKDNIRMVNFRVIVWHDITGYLVHCWVDLPLSEYKKGELLAFVVGF